jgi:hypothetical protein
MSPISKLHGHHGPPSSASMAQRWGLTAKFVVSAVALLIVSSVVVRVAFRMDDSGDTEFVTQSSEPEGFGPKEDHRMASIPSPIFSAESQSAPGGALGCDCDCEAWIAAGSSAPARVDLEVPPSREEAAVVPPPAKSQVGCMR